MLAVLLAAVLATAPPGGSMPIPDGFVGVADDTGTIVVAVPTTWTQRDTAPALIGAATVTYLAAAPDLAGFLGSFDQPGVMYVALPYAADPAPVLAQYGLAGGCATIEVAPYDDPVFTGLVQIGTGCGPQAMTWNMVVAAPADHAFTAVVQVQALADDPALRTALLTFNVASP